jgi:hypothetical protein
VADLQGVRVGGWVGGRGRVESVSRGRGRGRRWARRVGLRGGERAPQRAAAPPQARASTAWRQVPLAAAAPTASLEALPLPRLGGRQAPGPGRAPQGPGGRARPAQPGRTSWRATTSFSTPCSMERFFSTPAMERSTAVSNSAWLTSLRRLRPASSAASFTRLARSAPGGRGGRGRAG